MRVPAPTAPFAIERAQTHKSPGAGDCALRGLSCVANRFAGLYEV